MKAVDEEGSLLELGQCPRMGYHRVCGKQLVAEEPYSALSFYVNLLAQCLESGWCTNAIPASGRPARARRLNLATLQRMVNLNAVEAGLGQELSSPISISLTRPYEAPGFQEGYYRGVFDIAAHPWGVTLALRGGRGNRVLYIPRFQEPDDKTSLESSIGHLPLVYLVSFEIMVSIRLMEKASLVVVPPDPSYCEKGFKVDCFHYKGPSSCIYSRRGGGPMKCPLRPLTRRGAKQVGGAFYWLRRAWDKLLKAQRLLPPMAHHRLDYALASHFLHHLASEALELAVANARILGGNAAQVLDLYDQLGLGEHTPPEPPSPRLRELFAFLEKSRRERPLDNPHATRTSVIISLDGFPSLLRKAARLVEASHLYKYCRPTSLRPSQLDSLRAYIVHRYPLLGGQVAGRVAQAIASSLERYGCVEPQDLEGLVGEELARDILDYLSKRNILSRRAVGGHSLYNPTSLMRDLL